MAETLLVESPTWNGTYRSFNGDGTSTFWTNSFLPLWGRLCAIARYLRTDATIPIAGVTLQGITAGSGANLIGMPPSSIGGWNPGSEGVGTLFAFLEASFGAIFALDALKLPLAGGVMTGPLVFREPVTLSSSSGTLTLNFEFGIVPDAAAPRTYTVPAPSYKGQWFILRRNVVGGGNNVVIQRVDTTNIGTLPNSGIGWILFAAQDDGASGMEWSAWLWGGDATALGS
ncbi:MAG: hypothetical protein IPM54_25080 [Polyangiaceae bacterium]|nr:hypothetical protein [Polyangiaceae bacterium]